MTSLISLPVPCLPKSHLSYYSVQKDQSQSLKAKQIYTGVTLRLRTELSTIAMIKIINEIFA